MSTALNIFAAVMAVLISAGLVWLAVKYRSAGFYLQAAGFVWLGIARVLLVVQVEPFITFSPQVVLPFYLPFAGGLLWVIINLASIS